MILPLEQVLRPVDVQPPVRPGPGGHADADGPGLRRDRQRRHPALAADRRVDRRQARPEPSGRRIISPAVAWELRKMLRGVLADGGTASGAAIPGYDMAGKTGTAQVVVNGKYSNTKFVASFIGMVPGEQPEARGRGRRRRASGRLSTVARSPLPRSRRSSAGPSRTSGSTRARPRPARLPRCTRRCRPPSSAATKAPAATPLATLWRRWIWTFSFQAPQRST